MEQKKIKGVICGKITENIQMKGLYHKDQDP